jgi:hypothetical protein
MSDPIDYEALAELLWAWLSWADQMTVKQWIKELAELQEASDE